MEKNFHLCAAWRGIWESALQRRNLRIISCSSRAILRANQKQDILWRGLRQSRQARKKPYSAAKRQDVQTAWKRVRGMRTGRYGSSEDTQRGKRKRWQAIRTRMQKLSVPLLPPEEHRQRRHLPAPAPQEAAPARRPSACMTSTISLLSPRRTAQIRAALILSNGRSARRESLTSIQSCFCMRATRRAKRRCVLKFPNICIIPAA